MELKIDFGDGKETVRPVLVDKEFYIPYQFPHLRSIEKYLKQRNSKFAITFNSHNNKIKISGLFGVGLIKRIDDFKIIDCMTGKARLTATGVTPFGSCNNFFIQQKSIDKKLPLNTLLNYYTVISEHVHCPENYARQVLDARDELVDSKEAFNASQMNTNLQSMFAIDAAAADGSALDISGYDKKK